LVADPTFAEGDLVDRYEIRELIGAGGMGAIYRAFDTKLGRTVALKVVRSGRLDSGVGEQIRQRFLREALAASKVEHRNVVRVFDFGFAGDDTPYLAMEYLRGRDLGKLVNSSRDFLPVSEVVDIMLSVCAAVRACHNVGIIHRDLKPSNIFLAENDGEREVKVLDFGVSKAPMVNDLTREGQIVGTPQYLAPEQLDGRVLPETDQYAIGVVLYACLTKSLPYQGHADLSLLRAIEVGRFTLPCALRSDLPKELEAIILRAMHPVPEERFESVHALGRELWPFAGPAAQAQTRSFYFDPRPSTPPRASAHAMPLVEAMARGIGVKAAPSASLDLPIDVGTMSEGNARPAAAGVRTPAISSEPQASTAGATGRTKVLLLIAAGALVLAGAGWWTFGKPTAARPEQTVTPAPPAPAAAAPAPAAAPVAPPSNVQTTPAPSDRSSAPAPTDHAAPAPSPSTRPENRHRRNHQPTREKASDDVPIMP